MPKLTSESRMTRGHKLRLDFGWPGNGTHPAKRLAPYSVGWENALPTLRALTTYQVSGVKAVSADGALVVPGRIPTPRVGKLRGPGSVATRSGYVGTVARGSPELGYFATVQRALRHGTIVLHAKGSGEGASAVIRVLRRYRLPP